MILFHIFLIFQKKTCLFAQTDYYKKLLIIILQVSGMKELEIFIEKIIFASRWIQVPIYLGLIIGGLIYLYKFIIEISVLLFNLGNLNNEQILFSILTLIDISLVTNLLMMVIIGGYTIFVSKIDFKNHEDKPDWLENLDAGVIKIKLSLSIIIIAAIDLLRSFVDIQHQNYENVKLQICIFGAFLLMLIVVVVANRLTHDKKH